MATKSATPLGTDPDLINFFRLCRIVLEDIPAALRLVFKDEYSRKYTQEWIDGVKSGQRFYKQERFQLRLNSVQIKLLQSGSPNDWDVTLLVHTLLYSSHLLLANSFPGNQVSLHPNNASKLLAGSQVNFTNYLRPRDIVLCDLGNEFARCEIKYVNQSDIILTKAIRSSPSHMNIYLCNNDWKDVEKLSKIRNEQFAHCKNARITSTSLANVVKRIKKLYEDLRIPKQTINDMTTILTEIYGDECLHQKVLEYQDKWHAEMDNCKEIRKDIDHLHSDVDNVKVSVKAIEKDSKKHQECLEKQHHEIEDIKTSISGELSVIQNKIEVEAQEKASRLDSLESRQTFVEEKQGDITVLKEQQSNIASRIGHTIDLFKQVSDEHKDFEGKISALEETGKQMSAELEKNENFFRQLSTKDEERHGEIKDLKNDLGTIKSDIVKVKEDIIVIQQKGASSKFNVPRFEGDISFHSQRFHAGTRQWLLDGIALWKRKAVSNRNQPNMCLISGNPGMGKSVLAAKLCTMYKQENALAGCFFFQYHLGWRSNPKMLVQSLCHQFQSTLDGYSDLIQGFIEKIDPKTLSTFELSSYLISEPLSALQEPDKVFMVVIDALDECEFDSRPDLLKLLVRDFIKWPRWIQLILTSRPDKKILNFLKKIRTVIEVKPEDPRNLDDIRLFLKDFLEAKMSPEEFVDGVELLIEKSEGMFLYFQYAIDALEDKDHVSLEELKILLPDGIDDYYERNFSRLYDSIGHEHYHIFLQGILIARSDFPQDLVGPMLGVTSEESVKIVSMVSTLLPIHNGSICLFHKSLRDWLLDKELAGKYAIDPQEGHKHLATICRREIKIIKSNFSTYDLINNPVHQFIVQNAVHHICNGLALIQALELVQDLQFMFFRLLYNYGGTNGYLDDVNECLTLTLKSSKKIHRGFRDCYNFIRRHSHILEGNPSLILQCAMNEQSVLADVLEYHKFLANPLQAFPGLKVLLQVDNKSEIFISPSITFSSDDDIRSCALSPDSKQVVFIDSRGAIYYWDLETGETLHKVDLSDEIKFNSLCSISANRNIVAYGSVKFALNFEGEKTPLLNTETKCDINSCIFSPSGDKLLTFAFYQDGYFRLRREIEMPYIVESYIMVWNIATSTGKILHITKQEESRPMCASFTPDGKKIFFGYRNGVIVQWDSETYITSAYLLSPEVVLKEKEIEGLDIDFIQGNNVIFSIVLSPNGHFLAAATKEDLQIWDAAAVVFISAYKPPNADSRFTTCSFSSDSSHLVAGTTMGYLQIFAIKDFSFKLIASVKPDGSSIALSECMFVSFSEILCTFGNSGRIYKLDSLLQNSDDKRKSPAIHPGTANTSVILPQAEIAITLGNKLLCAWDVAKCELKSSAIKKIGGYLLRLSADGKMLLIYGDRCYIEVWDVNSLKKITDLIHLKQRNLPIGIDDPDESSPTDICHCAVSVDGVVVGGTGNGDLFLWYGENLQHVKELEGHEYLITYIEFSPNGGTFVTADMDGVVIMWQLPSERRANFEVSMIPLTRHDDSVEQLCFSSQGRRLASCSMDSNIHLYNGPSGDLIAKLTSHKSGVMKVSFSSIEGLLVSGDEKGDIIIWDGITGHLKHQIKVKSNAIIFDLQFVGQDMYVCSRDRNAGYIVLYEVSTGHEASRLSFTTEIFSVAASTHWKDKSYLVCCLKDGSVRFVKILDSHSMQFVG